MPTKHKMINHFLVDAITKDLKLYLHDKNFASLTHYKCSTNKHSSATVILVSLRIVLLLLTITNPCNAAQVIVV